MASGYCDRCGDASGAAHLCVPPFLDRVPTNHSSVHLVPRITTQEANAAHVAALEAANARMRDVLGRAYDYTWHHPDCCACDGAVGCDCGLTALDAEIEEFLEEAG